MQVTYRIPSKKVPYGFVEVVWEKADNIMPDPAAMAGDYAQYIKDYQGAEVAAFEAAPVKAKPAKPVVDEVEEAVKMLDEGLGVTEINESDPVSEAPWDKASDTEATSTEEKKPWTMSDSSGDASDWDFS
jgi:hypothetical protein